MHVHPLLRRRSARPGERRVASLLNAWRVALAPEAGALMQAATLHASHYVTVRHQFGKPIGALQSIQHRPARAYVLSQGTKWLARRPAWDTTDTAAAAAAACYGAEGVREVISTTHQVCGAIDVDGRGIRHGRIRSRGGEPQSGGLLSQFRILLFHNSGYYLITGTLAGGSRMGR